MIRTYHVGMLGAHNALRLGIDAPFFTLWKELETAQEQLAAVSTCLNVKYTALEATLDFGDAAKVKEWKEAFDGTHVSCYCKILCQGHILEGFAR